MSIFKFTKATAKPCCAASADTMPKSEPNDANGSRVKVLGSGCAKCNALEANVKAALSDMGMDIPIEHVNDFAQIAAFGVMSTPALVVDGTVVSSGKLLKKEEARSLLEKTLTDKK
ncbi:MAG TPA: thioredoxin family protein [Spirochaetales bacterium]|nr:thioredoxin family protein [Spirochaetales bacterium]